MTCRIDSSRSMVSVMNTFYFRYNRADRARDAGVKSGAGSLNLAYMRQVELTITFTDDAGSLRQHTDRLQTQRPGNPAGEHRVAHHLFAEFQVAMRDYAVPKHNAVAGKWLDFPRRPIDFSDWFDVRNAQNLWLELSNLIRHVEHNLEIAQAFKNLGPPQEPSFEDDEAINDLHFIHDRKMAALDRAVYELIKVQNLVDRLLHESLGGDLVDTADPDWEQDQLKRQNVEKGLEMKHASGAISKSVFDAITTALQIPKSTPHAQVARTYRNRLMHHVRPSVDYAIFFSALEAREGEEVTNASGEVVGRRHVLRARPPVQYQFNDLHASLTEYLDAVVTMLQKLSEVEILRR
jgi:hypothetical protein